MGWGKRDMDERVDPFDGSNTQNFDIDSYDEQYSPLNQVNITLYSFIYSFIICDM